MKKQLLALALLIGVGAAWLVLRPPTDQKKVAQGVDIHHDNSAEGNTPAPVQSSSHQVPSAGSGERLDKINGNSQALSRSPKYPAPALSLDSQAVENGAPKPSPPQSEAANEPGVPPGPHFKHVRHFVFNVERLYVGKTSAKITNPDIISGISGDYLGAMIFDDDSYAKLDVKFDLHFENDALTGTISVTAVGGGKRLISFNKKGALTELSYLGQDSVPSVGEVTVLSIQISPDERLAFSFPVDDRKKFEGIYFRKDQRVASFYFYREGSDF